VMCGGEEVKDRLEDFIGKGCALAH
jgi:hypothetical protein